MEKDNFTSSKEFSRMFHTSFISTMKCVCALDMKSVDR